MPTLKVSEIIKLSPTARAIRFNKNPFNFKPGQFIILEVDLEKTKKFKVKNKPKIQKRAYSISSSPKNKKYLEITVRTTDDPFVSDYLVNYLQKNEQLKVTGPFGNFYFNENKSNKNIVMIGAGSGICPLVAILRYIQGKKLNFNICLLDSNRRKNEILWKKDLEKLPKNITCEFTLTRENPKSWKGNLGRINKEMIQKNIKNIKKTDFYICGPPTLVKDTEKILLELNTPKKNIKKEMY